jgi:hypothetical protein
MKSIRILAACAGTAFAAAACGSSGSSPTSTTTPPSVVPSVTAVRSDTLSLNTTDPCQLLTAQQVASLVGGTSLSTQSLAKRQQPNFVIGADSTKDQADVAACVHADSAHGSLVQLLTLTSGKTSDFATTVSSGLATDVSSQLGAPAIQNKHSHVVYAIIDSKHIVVVQVGGVQANSVDPTLSLKGMKQLLDNLR